MPKKRLLLLLSFFLLILINFAGINYSFAHSGIKSMASSRTILDFTKERITKNFKNITTEHEIIKILNKKGIEKYSTLSFPFSKKNQKLKVYFIKITDPNGNIININLKRLKTVTAPFNPGAPIFSNQLLKTIQLPGLVKHSIIDYKYKNTMIKPYMKNNFFAEDYFGGFSPLKKSIFELIIPKGINYLYAQYKFKEKPRITDDGKDVILTWTVKNRKKITPEEFGPSESGIIPHVAVSSVRSWSEVARWYSNLTKDRIKPGSELIKFIKKLIESKQTKLNKIRAIYNFTAKKIRYVGYEFGIGGYKPSDVNAIFKNRLGDCKDHATLFASMLGRIGVKAYPVLIPTTEIQNMDISLPTPFVFDHEITAVRLNDGKFIFADTTSNVTTFGDLPPMDQGRNVLIIVHNKGIVVKTPIFSSKKNSISTKKFATIKNNGDISIKTAIVFKGAYDMYKRYLYSSTSKRERRSNILKHVLAIAPNAQYIKYTIENGNSLSLPYIEHISFSAENYAEKNGDIVVIKLPIRTRTTLSRITAPKHRKYLLRLGYNFSENSILRLKFPKNYRIIFIPKAMTIKNTVGTFTSNYTVNHNMVTFKLHFSVNGYKISRNNYLKAKHLFNVTIKNLSSQVLIFGKSKR